MPPNGKKLMTGKTVSGVQPSMRPRRVERAVMSDDDVQESHVPAPIHALPAVKRVIHDEDVVERCYQLWRQSAGNTHATVRRYAAEVEPGTPVPTQQTISTWARTHAWDARWTAEYQRDHGHDLYAIERRALELVKEHLNAMADAQAGEFDDNPAAGIVRMKPGELLGKLLEKQIIRLAPAPPQQTSGDGPDWQNMTQEELAAWARGEMQARKGKTG